MSGAQITRRSALRFSGAALGTAALGFLAGCGGDSPEDSTTTSGGGSTAPGSSTTGGSAGKVTEMTQLNASNGLKPMLEILNKKYTEDTGITIKTTTDGTNYDQTLHARAESGKMPDLFYPTGAARKSDVAPYAKAGWTMNLTAEMDDGWKDNFKPELLDFCTYKEGNQFGVEPGTYFIPFSGSDWQFYALPDVWKKADLDPTAPPETFDEFLSNMKAIKKVTPQAFGLALSQSYVTEAFLKTFASAVMSPDDIAATAQGESSWNTPEWQEVLGMLEQIRDADILMPGAINTQMPDLEKAFFSQRALGCFWGFTIDIPVGQVLAPDWSDFNIFMPPPVDKGHEMRIAGGAGKVMAINGKSDKKDAALAYLKWFMEPEQQSIFAQKQPAIPANPAVDQVDLDPRVQPFAKVLSKILPPECAFTAQAGDALNRGIQDLMNKKSSAEDVLKAADKAQKESA